MRFLRLLSKELPLVKLGHPALRRQAAAIDRSEIGTTKLNLLVEQMIDTMRAHGAQGISAPQVGHAKRISIYEFNSDHLKGESQVRDVDKLGMQLLPLTVLFNLEVTPTTSKTCIHREGCISVPGFSAHVPRFVSVKASAWDREGEAFAFDCSDWTARIVQHEHDHLEGQLYIDRMDTSTFSHEVERWKWPLLPQDIEYDGERGAEATRSAFDKAVHKAGDRIFGKPGEGPGAL